MCPQRRNSTLRRSRLSKNVSALRRESGGYKSVVTKHPIPKNGDEPTAIVFTGVP
jgi:hypothetical protein